MVDGGPLLPKGDETLRGTARSLLASVNDASIAARNGWLFFLALLAYLFIAAASVSHKDLLLNTPVVLPFLGIALRLNSFFLFGPLVLLFVHFGLLVQHVLLSRKIIELDTILREDEAWRGKRSHPLRLEMHSYFYTQALAGSNRSAVFATFLHGMVWLSLVLLPVFLIIYFQVTFLPYHSQGITWAHRIYLMVEIIILLGVGIFLRRPNANFWQAVWRTGSDQPTNFIVTIIAVGFALFFSIFVATFPGEWIDRQLIAVKGLTKQIYMGKAENGGKQEAGLPVFTPTAYFFADTGHTLSGFKDMFRRNLVVTDEVLSVDGDGKGDEDALSFRTRNLSYANLSRSDLQKADFTDAELENAILIGTILNNAKFGCRVPQDNEQGAATREAYKLRGCAMLSNANFSSAKLKNADFSSTYSPGVRFGGTSLNRAVFDYAILTKASFYGANGPRASFKSAILTESEFTNALMQGADFSGAQALATDFLNAKLTGAIFSYTHLQGANFETAELSVTDFNLADLWGVNFNDADINGADFSLAEMWGPVPPEIDKNYKVYFNTPVIEPPSKELQDALRVALENEDLTPETQVTIETMLSEKSMKEWKSTKDYAAWITMQKQFDGADPQAFKSAYTKNVVKLACDNVRVEPETTTGVIIRVAKPNFPGDIETFLTEMKKPECQVFELISQELRDKLLFEVHRRRRDGE